MAKTKSKPIKESVKILLALRSGGECANPFCHNKLTSIYSDIVLGEICHIEAASEGGPRYNEHQDPEERRGYDNLIMLCEKCHKEIDHNAEQYPVEKLKKWKKDHEEKIRNLYNNQTKVFSFSVPIGLLPRDKEADTLFDEVITNRFFNLIGVGGSGKSSLAYLMMQKHESDFNEIAYVVVNNKINIIETIVSQFKEYLKIDLKEDDVYKQLVTYLDNNFKSSKPNLLVLDINELSDETKDFAKNIHKLCPNSWRVLILSREYIDPSEIITKKDLNQKQDPEFLQELFLKRAGNRYADFDSFDDLFATVFHNPLLIEQLGFYLSKLPEKKSIEEIKAILFGNKFKNKDLKGFAVLTNDNRSTMIEFLTNLLPFDADYLDDNEKELLRHFILWPVDFINYKVIQKLLRGVFESDDDLDGALEKLTDRALLTTQTLEDGCLSYKLHGLLAESLREQIDYSVENYPIYEKNTKINDIHRNDSIDEDICKYTSISLWGEKKQDQPEWQYLSVLAHRILARLTTNIKSILLHLNKSIEIGSKLPTDNPEYQDICAETYLILGYFILSYCEDYKLAQEYYDKAIYILDQLPKDNPDYQMHLALAYNDYGFLYQTYLVDYRQAEFLYKKSIYISINNSKDAKDSYKLDVLAMAYTNLGMIQLSYLGDSKRAEMNLYKAIKIGERNIQDNNDPQFLNTLLLAYCNFGLLQQTYLGDYKSATVNYNNVIRRYKNISKDTTDPLLLNAIALAFCNLGLIQQSNLNDVISAEENYNSAIKICEGLTNNLHKQHKFNTLALSYCNLGVIYDIYYEDIKTAEHYYNKAIELGMKIINVREDAQALHTLALAYNNIALIQEFNLFNYESAKDNYNKSILYSKKVTNLAKNPQFLNTFALTYNNLATLLQKDYFKDYKTAKDCFDMAIKLRTRLPKDNAEYQHSLASVYNQLAYFHKNRFKDYETAKDNCNKAIEIEKQLSINHPDKYTIELINCKHSLADMYYVNNELNAAKFILSEIKPQAEQCLADNPDEERTKEVNNDIDDLIAKIQSKTH